MHLKNSHQKALLHTHAQCLSQVTCNVQRKTERELISRSAKRHIQSKRKKDWKCLSIQLFTVVLHLRSVNWYSEINIGGVSGPVKRAAFMHYNHTHCVSAALAGLNAHLKCYISITHYYSVGLVCTDRKVTERTKVCWLCPLQLH